MRNLLNMPPSSTEGDFRNCGRSHAEQRRYIFARRAVRAHVPYRYDVAVSQFCKRDSRSASVVSSALQLFVRHVVGVGATKQMFRVAARSIVTVVADIKTIRNWAIGQFPRDPMSQGKFRVFVDTTVARFHSMAEPRPARIWAPAAINASPEIVAERWFFQRAISKCHSIVNETHLARLDRFGALPDATNLVRRLVGMYGVVSQGEPPARCGQKRRPVSSGRRFAFMPYLMAAAQGAA